MRGLQLFIPALLIAAQACSQSSAPPSFADTGGVPTIDVLFDLDNPDRVPELETWDFSISDAQGDAGDNGARFDAGFDVQPADAPDLVEPDLAVLPDGDTTDVSDTAWADSADLSPDAPDDVFEAADSDLLDAQDWDTADDACLDAEEGPGADEWECDGSPDDEELCDGVDNDCDGETDEGVASEPCSLDNEYGSCPGASACFGGETICVGLPAGPEQCDGIDNDCNDLVDEDLGATTCGVGVCLHTVNNCVDGVPQVCEPTDGVDLEKCNGLDDDCDDAVDEGDDWGECVVENEFGSCPGASVCKSGSLLCKAVPPAPEVCDGADNDCDDEIDEELDGQACLVENEYGACPGVAECAGAVGSCIGPSPAPEVCDGLDNDCDGTVDEDLGSTECGLGVCNHTVQNCVGGIPQACEPMDGFDLEKCDGLDNDCDGTADEGLGSTECGLGVCLHTVNNCVGGIPQACDPMDGSDLEKCDGMDNDCDGETDEDFSDHDLDGVMDCVDVDDDDDGDPDDLDCGPLDPEVFHGQVEACFNFVDDDCDESTVDECVLKSCQAVLDTAPDAPDDQYTIDPDGDGGVAPFAVQCEMDGGAGWIALSITNSDGVVIGEHSTYNPWHKCADDGAAHFHWLAGETAAPADYSPATTFIQDVALGYRNPGAGTIYSASQTAAIRGLVAELSSTTRMVAVTGDDDYGNYQAGGGHGHEVYVMGSSGEWKLLTPGTNGECGGGTIWPQFGSESAFYLWATDASACETDGHTGLGGGALGGLPAGDILPFQVRLTVQTGGGVAFGWEEKEFLVR